MTADCGHVCCKDDPSACLHLLTPERCMLCACIRDGTGQVVPAEAMPPPGTSPTDPRLITLPCGLCQRPVSVLRAFHNKRLAERGKHQTVVCGPCGAMMRATWER